MFLHHLRNSKGPKGTPSLEYFRLCETFFSNVLKRSPLRVFSYFATECMLINPKGSPLLLFSALFLEEIFFQKLQVFFRKIVLRFLSLRYSADFRRSRLV